MCGLYGGFSNVLSNVEKARIGDLAVLSELRGTDSGGFFTAYREDKEIKIGLHKDAQPSSAVINSYAGGSILDTNNTFLVAGHSRAATVGVVTKRNAHPFQVGHIVGMHNGTIHGLPGDISKTDSERLFTILSEEGIQEAVNAARGGAYALVWVDGNNRTLNFLRNKERPLCFLRHGVTFYWSSESIMLRFLKERDGITASSEPFMLAEHTMMSVCLDSSQVTKKTVEPEEPKRYVYSSTVPSVPLKRGITDHFDTSREVTDLTKRMVSKYGINNATVLGPTKHYERQGGGFYRGFKGKTMPLSKAHALLSKGCANCGQVCSAHDVVWWYNNKEFACNDCKDDPFLKEFAGYKHLYKGAFNGKD